MIDQIARTIAKADGARFEDDPPPKAGAGGAQALVYWGVDSS